MENMPNWVIYFIAADLVLFIGFFYLVINLQKKRKEEYKKIASRNGWKVDFSNSRYRFCFQGPDWELKASRSKNGPQSSGIMSTEMKFPNIKISQGAICVGPPIDERVAQFLGGDSLIFKFLARLIGDEMNHLSGAELVTDSFESMKKDFSVLATDAALAEEKINSEVISHLTYYKQHLNVKNKPVIFITPLGLNIRLRRASLKKAHDIENFVNWASRLAVLLKA